jgi:hypothetical protein
MESPKHQRMAVYATIKREGSTAEMEEVKEAVRAEYQRKLAWKDKRKQ